jgi:protein-S-isoprenylcysteine O-methyltransferase Ste14
VGKFKDWGFTSDSWRGRHGEYWVLAQSLILVGFVLLPKWHPISWEPLPSWVMMGQWAISIPCAVWAVLLLGKGLLDLGENLTPLPYPRETGTLIQTGVYALVRHCLYSGLIFGTFAYGVWALSLPHLLACGLLLVVLDLKSRQEERWLAERFPEYTDYQQRVKKFIPGLY